jgi:NAD(P)-dependent dehydrogenase (short-subunit alcohol dehydrogenase family)
MTAGEQLLVAVDSVGGDSPRSDLLASQTRLKSSAAEPEIDLREPPRRAPLPEREAAPGPREDPLHPMIGKMAVVTGGGTETGRAIAHALLDAGARVCVLGPDVEELRETAHQRPHLPILYLQCDMGSVSDISGAADFISRVERPVDVLVHAADTHVRHGVSGGLVADLDEQYLVNLRSPYLLTERLFDLLCEGPGHVVLLDSARARAGDVQHAMSKAGLSSLADGLRAELIGTGVRVTVVHDHHETGDVDPIDVADCVLGALEMPRRIELTELHVRATPHS